RAAGTASRMPRRSTCPVVASIARRSNPLRTIVVRNPAVHNQNVPAATARAYPDLRFQRQRAPAIRYGKDSNKWTTWMLRSQYGERARTATKPAEKKAMAIFRRVFAAADLSGTVAFMNRLAQRQI